jgi:hypothetical protein
VLGVLSYLESEFSSGSPQVQNFIAVSFVEYLPHADEDGSQLRTMIGPNLQRELAAWDNPELRR